jgi:hypothetical protein
MDNNAQSVASTSNGATRGSIDLAARQAYPIGGSIASRFMKRSFHLRAPCGFARRHPKAAYVQEVVASHRGLRTGALIAFVFGILALDTGSALAGPCATKIKRIESALDALTSNSNASAVHQSLRAQLHRQPTPRSVARGEEQAIADERQYLAALERTRAADANNDEVGCMKALPELRHDLIVR